MTIRNGSAVNGGGILNGFNLTLDRVLLTDNVAENLGGGVDNSGSGGVIKLVDSTVSGNRAGGEGGGIFQGSSATAELASTTVTGNVADSDSTGGGDGGGINQGAGEVTMSNSIVAGNTDRGGEAPDCAGDFDSGGNNLLGTPLGCTLAVLPSDIINVPARLRGLADNGGPTFTHALRSGSRAINTGGGCPGVDQRGLPRPLGGRCDMGAYERARCGGVVIGTVGTSARDKLRGTAGADGLLGLGGNDILRGLVGKDALCGGAGRDRLLGGKGRDKLLGGKGRDRLLGGPGRDRLPGGPAGTASAGRHRHRHGVMPSGR